MQAEQEDRFQEFVRARWSHLVRTAYLLTGDAHHAEDLTQTALAKAYRSWRRVSRSDNPEAYVRRMLVSCNSDRFRKRRVREALTAAPPERAGRDETYAWADERSALLPALAELPPRQRAVVVMRYWEDLSEAEVAEVLGCSAGTVKSQASKGLAKLRAYPGLAGVMGGSDRSQVSNGGTQR
ncbi:SigE family RNA polymerase sigma factor [Streptomyces sp. CC219B]|uniref:SigE family RNA polymerase sigma factor n=1 Tax=Streptomyces sp. CC219B TaxID=3044574 RepID=UPI0024A9B805|nr:SigE family RNA polymerase sigma factor [Streptomyces sp. CC219B]